MKVLFVLADSVAYQHEPLGVMYLSTAARLAGHECEVTLSRLESPVEVARKFQPDVLAFSVTTGTHHNALRINRELRAELGEGVWSLFGGPHATFFPQLINQDGVDAVCIGDGEEALVELLDVLAAGEQPRGIPNWHLKIDGKIEVNPVRPLRADLDQIAFPDRRLLDRHSLFQNLRARYFMTSRGCPYKCTYCFNHVYHELYRGKGKMLRKRSVGNVIDEIREVRKSHPFRSARFIDDILVAPHQVDWLEEFADIYPREIGIPFLCYMRLDHITPQIAAGLRRAGCVTILVGLEAGNDHMRQEVLNRRMSREQIIEGSRIIREHGMHLILQNMLALPGSTVDNDLETLDLNIECKPSYSLASLYQPYPGTVLGDAARADGSFSGDIDDIPEYYFNETVLEVEGKEQRQTLQRLFALFVQMPWLRRWAPRLLRLPRNRVTGGLLQLAHLGWKYIAYRRTRVRV